MFTAIISSQHISEDIITRIDFIITIVIIIILSIVMIIIINVIATLFSIIVINT